MAAQEEHERLVDASLNDAAVQGTVHIDPGLAPGILGAELCGLCSAKGMTKYSHPRHVETSLELAGRVGGVQPLQPVEDEGDVGGPRSQHPVHTTGLLGLLLALTEFRVILRRPSHHPAIGETYDKGAIGGIEAYDDVPVTGQILGECRVIPHLEGSPNSHNHHRVRSLPR